MKLLDRLGKALLIIGGRHQVGLGLDLVAGVAHGNAEARRREHRQIVAAITEHGDLACWDAHKLGQHGQRRTLVGDGVGDVEIVGLRACHGRGAGEGDPELGFAAGETVMVVSAPTILTALAR